MVPKDADNRYDDLLSGGVPAASEDYSLEEILAEFGAGEEQRLLRGTEAEETPPSAPPQPRQREAAPAQAPAQPRRKEAAPAVPAQPESPEAELPPAPRPIPLEEVVGSTVDAVMEESREPLLKPRRRRGLFSRKPMEEEETEELYQRPPAPEPEPEAEPIGPEPDLVDVSEACRRESRILSAPLPAAAVVSLLPAVLLAAETYGLEIPFWTGQVKNQCLVLLGCLAVVSLLARRVYLRAFRLLSRRRCSSQLLAVLSALASAADCVLYLTSQARSAAMPYAAVSCMALTFALWGAAREGEGYRDTFRAAAVDDEPPYLVTETERGACKQRGAVRGFYTTAVRDDAVTVWQAVLLPVVLVATVVFAGLSSLGQGRGADFLLNWSAILAAGATFALPLCWALPFSKLARHLQKTGCAVAGWSGAEKISSQRRMILTDGDLFPPGTIQLNGVKVFGEELGQAASYAATLARCAGCGLERVFDGLLRSEGGRYQEAQDFSFYEEGGYSATIHGETVLLGTASFMRKMEVRLPGNINLKTGIFLAVDRQLAAAFAVKYHAAENVDFALRMMRRSRVTPVLASRDPNITPALLKRKFHKGVKVEYPDLTDRVALSEAEQDRGLPRGLIFREGLLPYAEAVCGSRRLCRAVRRAAGLSFFASAAGTLLTSYLAFQGSYDLLSPLALLVFSLLWTAPVLLMADWTGRY